MSDAWVSMDLKSHIHIQHFMSVLLHQHRKICVGYEEKCYNIYDDLRIIHSFVYYIVCLSVASSKGISTLSAI
jgi:hypothetical protein